jgi:hypothetical protein
MLWPKSGLDLLNYAHFFQLTYFEDYQFKLFYESWVVSSMPHLPTWRTRLPLCLAEVALPSARPMLSQLFSSLMDISPLTPVYNTTQFKWWRYHWGGKGLWCRYDINIKKELQQTFGGGNEGTGGGTYHFNKCFRTYSSGIRMSQATHFPNQSQLRKIWVHLQ